jgi:hypothetical protein
MPTGPMTVDRGTARDAGHAEAKNPSSFRLIEYLQRYRRIKNGRRDT